MTTARTLISAALLAAAAAPAAAQDYQYPQSPQNPQTYPQYPQGTYPQYPQGTYPQYPQGTYPPYPQYPQGTYPNPYGYIPPYSGNPAVDVIDQLLGNRYSVTDRQAIRACANAARNQALGQYGGYGQGYGGYSQGNRVYANNLRVTAITNVERRSYGLRVNGMLGSGAYPNQYGGQYGYQDYRPAGELNFRCNVDYRGAVTELRVWPGYRG